MDRLYNWLSKNAADPIDFFHIPPGRVVETGTQLSVQGASKGVQPRKAAEMAPSPASSSGAVGQP